MSVTKEHYCCAQNMLSWTDQEYSPVEVLVENLSAEAIGRIEYRMRPGRCSQAGFLDHDESLVEVVQRDFRTLTALSITHGELGGRLDEIVKTAEETTEVEPTSDCEQDWDLYFCMFGGGSPGMGVEVDGKFLVRCQTSMGGQGCPFEDKMGNRCPVIADGIYHIFNAVSERELMFPALAVHLIREHCFFEGSVPCRVDPSHAVDVLEL